MWDSTHLSLHLWLGYNLLESLLFHHIFHKDLKIRFEIPIFRALEGTISWFETFFLPSPWGDDNIDIVKMTLLYRLYMVLLGNNRQKKGICGASLVGWSFRRFQFLSIGCSSMENNIRVDVPSEWENMLQLDTKYV